MSNELELDYLSHTKPNDYNHETWVPRTEAHVNWVSENAIRAATRLKEVRELAEHKINQVKEWLEKHENKLKPELNHWEALAITWFKNHREELLAQGTPEDKLPKTISLISGAQLTARRTDGKTIVKDADAAVKYLYQNGYRDYVQVTRTIKAAEVKKHVRSTGELIPGVEIEEPSINWKLKT